MENNSLATDYFDDVSPQLAQIKTAGNVILEFFPPGFIALQKELATGLHRELERKLANHGAAETELKLAEIAMHCSVVLNGTYTLEEREHLCYVLAGRLEVLREIPTGEIVM